MEWRSQNKGITCECYHQRERRDLAITPGLKHSVSWMLLVKLTKYGTRRYQSSTRTRCCFYSGVLWMSGVKNLKEVWKRQWGEGKPGDIENRRQYHESEQWTVKFDNGTEEIVWGRGIAEPYKILLLKNEKICKHEEIFTCFGSSHLGTGVLDYLN